MSGPRSPSGVGRWIGFLALVAAGWLIWGEIQRPLVAAIVTLTGGPAATTGTTLGLHRYVVIGAARLAWWSGVTLLAAHILARRPGTVTGPCAAAPAGIARGLAAGAIAMATTIALIVAAGAARLTAPTAPLADVLPRALAWLGAEIMIAAAEELLFRAILFALLLPLTGRWPALLLSALLFAAAHGDAAHSALFALQLLAAGAVLALAVLRSGALWWSIGLHAGWNWTCATVFGAINSGVANDGQIWSFAAQGPRLLTGGSIGPEASVCAFAGWAAAAVLLLWGTQGRARSRRARA